jgi:hypothetical protein
MRNKNKTGPVCPKKRILHERFIYSSIIGEQNTDVQLKAYDDFLSGPHFRRVIVDKLPVPY